MKFIPFLGGLLFWGLFALVDAPSGNSLEINFLNPIFPPPYLLEKGIVTLEESPLKPADRNAVQSWEDVTLQRLRFHRILQTSA